MPKMDVINQEGKVVSSIELKDEIFGSACTMQW